MEQICKYCNTTKNKCDFRINRLKCIECERKDGRDYRKSDIGKSKSSDWVNSNTEHYKQLQRDWSKSNRDHINNKYNDRYKNDIEFRIHKNCQRRLGLAIKKQESTIQYLGCEISFLLEWFMYCIDGTTMTINNHGSVWHIDHVVPVSLFDLTDNNDIYTCFNWTNLCPLYAVDNLKKNKNLDLQQISIHLKKLQDFHKIHSIELTTTTYNVFAKHLIMTGNSLES